MRRNLARLFRILKGKYHLLVISIILLIVVQLLNFVSPLIVKEILDDCILGIEYNWMEVDSVNNTDDKYVSYNNHLYKQERYISENDEILSDASIMIYNGKFYFVDEKKIDGKKELNDNILSVSNKEESDR